MELFLYSNYSGVQISWPRIFWDGSQGNNHNQPILANLYLLTDFHGDEANFLLVGKGTVLQYATYPQFRVFEQPVAPE